MTDIFVSYAREDRDRIAPLVTALEARGWSVWWDPTIAYGSDYSDTIEKALEQSRCVLVAWSKDSVPSHWVREEAAVGRSRNALVPVRLDDVQPPIGFRHLQTADLVSWSGEPTAASEKVLDDVGGLLDRLGAEPADGAETEAAATDTVSAPPIHAARPRWVRLVARAALVIVALLAVFWLLRPMPQKGPLTEGYPLEPLPLQSAVAVLAFENLTGNEQLSYVGTGLAAGLIIELSALPGINLVGKSRAWPASERAGSLAGLAEVLGVSLLIEGEVHALTDALRVDVSAVDGPSSLVLWSGRFTGRSDALFDLQEEIVVAVTRLLSASLSDKHRTRIARGGPPAQAFDFYLQGLERLDQADNPRHAEFAADLFRQAIRGDGEVAIFHAALSDAIWTQHLEGLPGASLAEAEKEARRALELVPELPQAHLALARSVRGQGQFAAAIAQLRPMLATHPKPDEAFRELAFGYEHAGDLEAAADCYGSAVALGPENWFNWNAQGAFLAQQGRMADAETALVRAVELAPESAGWPRQNLGAVKVMTGDNAGAIEQFEAAGLSAYEDLDGSRVRPATAALANNMANAYYFSGQHDEALALFERVVELEPDDHVYRRNLGDVLLELKREQEALAEFRQAWSLVEAELVRFPDSDALLSARALYAAKTEDCDAAVPLAEEARRLLAGGWQNHLNLAGAFALCAQRDEAMSQVEACLAIGLPGGILRQQAELQALWEDVEFIERTGGG